MAKPTFVKTVTRDVFGGTFYFHVYKDTRMIHVFGSADRASTGGPLGSYDAIINDLVGQLLERGNCPAGPFGKPY